MSDEDTSSEFAETTTEGDSDSSLSEETSTNVTTTASTAGTNETSTNDTATVSTAETSETSTNEGTVGSTSETTDVTTDSEYESGSSTTDDLGSSIASGDRESVDAEWNMQNFLLPQDIFNLDSRRIRAEDPHWALSPVPEISTIIIRGTKSIEGPGIASLKANAETEQWRRILELLPLTVSFKYTLPAIEDGVYWKRQCTERWPGSQAWRYGDSWKAMLIERQVQEEIEIFNPEVREISELENFLKIFQNYISKLQILKLVKIEKKRFVVDLSLEDFDDLLDDFINKPQIHTSFLDLEKVFGCLTNLQELNFVLMPSCLDPETHQLSVPDFNALLRGLRRLGNLQKFRCSNGIATNTQLNILVRHFIELKCLTQLNMSFNFIDDDSCDAIGQLLLSQCPLEVLILKYNKISDGGAIAIASTLSDNTKLKKLDLSLNWIGNKGGSFLAKVLSTNQYLEDLNISNNKLGQQAGLSFANVLKISKTLRSVNLSDNNIGEIAGNQLVKAMEENTTILELGIQFCNLLPPNEDAIYRSVVQNRLSTYTMNGSDLRKHVTFFREI